MMRGVFFFFNDTATTEIYTLSLHDALPISGASGVTLARTLENGGTVLWTGAGGRSEEHTSELQSRPHLVCRLLLEKNTTVGVVDGFFNLGRFVCCRDLQT